MESLWTSANGQRTVVGRGEEDGAVARLPRLDRHQIGDVAWQHAFQRGRVPQDHKLIRNPRLVALLHG